MVESKGSDNAPYFKVRQKMRIDVSLTTSQLEEYLDEVEQQKQTLQEDCDN